MISGCYDWRSKNGISVTYVPFNNSNLNRPTRQQILQHCKFMIRKLEYEEMTRLDPLYAMGYLQTRLSDIIDHNDPAQLKQFHKLAALLFHSEPQSQSTSQNPSLNSTPMCSSPDLESRFILINK